VITGIGVLLDIPEYVTCREVNFNFPVGSANVTVAEGAPSHVNVLPETGYSTSLTFTAVASFEEKRLSTTFEIVIDVPVLPDTAMVLPSPIILIPASGLNVRGSYPNTLVPLFVKTNWISPCSFVVGVALKFRLDVLFPNKDLMSTSTTSLNAGMVTSTSISIKSSFFFIELIFNIIKIKLLLSVTIWLPLTAA
jgi:hypothetical protein